MIRAYLGFFMCLGGFGGIIGMALKKLFWYTNMTQSAFFLANWYFYPIIFVIFGIGYYLVFKEEQDAKNM